MLTFDLRDDADADLEGDVALCVDEAARRAAERGHPVRDEVLLYAVHGLLHLLGEDDHTPADYARMHAREDALLTAIGVGPRFAVPPVAAGPRLGVRALRTPRRRGVTRDRRPVGRRRRRAAGVLFLRRPRGAQDLFA